MELTTLDALLLFLTSEKQQSGYDIRQLFQATPVGMFSDSPGAIYPALARLESRGLLASRAEAGGRRRRTFERTPAGEAALRGWLNAPIEAEVVARRPQDLDLRFVITAEMLGPEPAARFLADYTQALQARADAILAFRDGPARAMSRASQEAVDLGTRIDQARLNWCRELLSTYGETEHEPPHAGT